MGFVIVCIGVYLKLLLIVYQLSTQKVFIARHVNHSSDVKKKALTSTALRSDPTTPSTYPPTPPTTFLLLNKQAAV